MVYKDKDKQREANRQASQRRRDMLKGMATQGVMDAGVTVINKQPNVIPKYPRVSDQDFTRHLATLPPGSPTVRVSKPGDDDYEPQCETTKAFVEGQTLAHLEGKDCKPVEDMIEDVSKNGGEYSFKTVKGKVQDVHHIKPKRGLDIKCFEDLPPDVQQTIVQISQSPEEKRRRTGIAIRYQHLFPERYYG